MTVPRAPKPKPPALTPEQKARAIDARNEQASTRVTQAPKVSPMPKPTGRR
jgi:hypothetical protein